MVDLFEVDFREVGNEVGWVVVIAANGRRMEGYGPYETEGRAWEMADMLNHGVLDRSKQQG